MKKAVTVLETKMEYPVEVHNARIKVCEPECLEKRKDPLNVPWWNMGILKGYNFFNIV